MARSETHADEPRVDRPIVRLARTKRVLPWLAAIGMAVALAALLVTSVERSRMSGSTDETKAVAEGVLETLVAMHPSAADDAAFLAALDRARHATHVAGAWCFRADGRLVWAQGSTAASTTVGQTAEDLATNEARRIAETLGTEWPNREARLALLAASAIAREGEHNDIFRHALRTLHDPDGRLTGFVGLVYEASPSRGGPGVTYVAALLLLLAGLGVYWLALPVWVLLDAEQRGERAFVWAAFTAMGNLVALAAYLLTRRSDGGATAAVESSAPQGEVR
jgi:hypothetical protein